MCTPDLFLAVLAILFPPIAVWIKVGICSADSIINIALCCLGYLPGLLHSWYIILKHPEPDEEYVEGYQAIVGHHGGYQDPEGGRVTYYYVAHAPPQQAHPHAQRTYGTTPPFQQQQQQYQQQYASPVPDRHSDQAQQQSSHKQNSRPEDTGGSNMPAERTRPPPTYAEAVKGGYKVQDQD
ncbi:hypothetical protein VTO42DRAFT_8463 [Malbranchea cinnamomea]